MAYQMQDLPILSVVPRADHIDPDLNSGFCLLKQTRLSRSQDVVLERQCAMCKFRQPGESPVTVGGERKMIAWEACQDQK